MAIVLDINILCNKVLDIDLIDAVLDKFETNIESIHSIDNWMWENQQDIESLGKIEEVLNHNGIIVIKLKNPIFVNVGIYIEKIEDFYLYELWINTEGYPILDSDIVTSENRIYYEKIYELILEIHKSDESVVKVVGIGLETDFYYSEDVIAIIHNSSNMTSWIINSDIWSDMAIRGFVERKIEGLKMIVLEKHAY